jgi:hypothetical protein
MNKFKQNYVYLIVDQIIQLSEIWFQRTHRGERAIIDMIGILIIHIVDIKSMIPTHKVKNKKDKKKDVSHQHRMSMIQHKWNIMSKKAIQTK